MYFFYNLVNNYGVALILFTLVTKLLLLPLAIKQQKQLARTISFKPRLDEIQKKYARNREKMNEEVSKLYKEEKFNPMSGCLPLLIQFPILFGLIYVIYRPLTTIVRLSAETITAATEIATRVLNGTGMSAYSPEISVINAIHVAPDQFSMLGGDVIAKIQNLDLNFLGIDLGSMPSMAWNLLLLVPILSGVTSIMLSLISIKNSSMGKDKDGNVSSADKMSKNMMLVMPAMSVVIAFQVPAGVGMYWILTNIFSTIQSLILYKVFNPREMAAKAAAEMEARKQQEKEERKAAKALARELGQEVNEEAKKLAQSQKELNRQKLAEARRQDAEKYGESYVEVTEDDIK